MAEVVDLVPLILWAVAFSILWLLATLAAKVHGVFSGLPWPLSAIGNPIADAIGVVQNALEDAASGAEAQVAKWFNGLTSWVYLILSLPLLLAEGIYKALQYAWTTALDPRIEHIAGVIRTTATNALTKVEALAGTVTNNLIRAERYTDTQIADASQALTNYADKVARDAAHTAEGYADEAVSKLRSAEDAAVSNAVKLANDAKAAGEAAAAKATTEAEAVSARALAQVDAAFTAALGDVRGIAVGAEHGITDLQKYIDSLGLAGLIAAVPALAILVNTLATESGLDSSACRAKNKQICGTDPNVWTSILLGAAAAGIALDYKALIEAGLTLARDVEGGLAELVHVAAGAEDDIARIIGDAANAIAA